MQNRQKEKNFFRRPWNYLYLGRWKTVHRQEAQRPGPPPSQSFVKCEAPGWPTDATGDAGRPHQVPVRTSSALPPSRPLDPFGYFRRRAPTRPEPEDPRALQSNSRHKRGGHRAGWARALRPRRDAEGDRAGREAGREARRRGGAPGADVVPEAAGQEKEEEALGRAHGPAPAVALRRAGAPRPPLWRASRPDPRPVPGPLSGPGARRATARATHWNPEGYGSRPGVKGVKTLTRSLTKEGRREPRDLAPSALPPVHTSSFEFQSSVSPSRVVETRPGPCSLPEVLGRPRLGSRPRGSTHSPQNPTRSTGSPTSAPPGTCCASRRTEAGAGTPARV